MKTLLGLALVLVGCGTTVVGSRFVKSEAVDATRGAVITVSSTDSKELAGTVLEIPAGALASNTVITVEPALQTLVTDGDAVGPTVIWGPSGLTFSSAATMTLPVALTAGDDASTLEVIVEEADGTVFAIPSVSLDSTRGLVTFKVTGFSAYQVRRRASQCGANAACAAGEQCVNGTCRRAGQDGGVVGACRTDADCGVSQRCLNGQCTLRCVPTPEVCDGRDNDCNGVIDEGCNMNPVDGGQVCRTNADCGTAGQCVQGRCVALCTPSREVCDGRDNDCNGIVDDNCPQPDGGVCAQSCAPGEVCVSGRCVGRGDGGTCLQAEICGDGRDNDCNGVIDDGCNINDGGLQCRSNADCGVGAQCVMGRCVALCRPSPEICDGLDNDCNGLIDDNCQRADAGVCSQCAPGQVCANGVCVSPRDGGACLQAEICGDGLDNDCNGLIDDSCQRADAGVCSQCAAGQVCANGVCVSPRDGGACLQAEICGDGVDNDCNGLIDDNCARACRTDLECAAGQTCVQNVCR